MDLTSKTIIKTLLGPHQVLPSKRLGQNFLIDKGAVRKIIEAADLQPDDIVLEIGPGLGVLTQELAKEAKKVIAVEKDKNMVEILGETLKEYENIEIINEDIRRSDLPQNYGGGRTSQKFKVVGNLPFYLTAPIIRQFLERTDSRCLYAVFMVQKEVGQRICAKPPDMNLLAVSVQFYAEPKIISYVSKKSFWPSPEVDAAVIKIIPKPQNVQTSGVCMFFKVVKAGFSQPRKQLINNLSNGLKLDKNKVGEWLLKNNIQPAQRAETLSIKDWLNLTAGYQIL